MLDVEKYSILTDSGNKKIIFKCEFCSNKFETLYKTFLRSKHGACIKCRSLASAYSQTNSSKNKHEFYLERRKNINKNLFNIEATIEKFGYSPLDLVNGSKKRIIAKCEFCLLDFETQFDVINNESNLIACKKCDAIASSYSRSKSIENKHEFYLSKRPKLNIDCLDIEATIEKFNYSPLDLSTYSAKIIVAKCAYCSKKLEIRMSKYSLREGRITCWGCMRKKTVETLKLKYGVECTLQIPSVLSKLSNPKTEQIVESVLKTRYKLDYVRNHSIGIYSFDFFVPSCNLLIECHGDYFHDFKKFGYSGTPKDRAKSTYVEKYTNHKLIWVYEHEIHIGRINKILDYHIHKILEPQLNVDLKYIEFKQINNKDAHTFLSQYHYIGNLGTVATSFGAFFGEVLIAVCVFGGITRHQSIKKINKFCSTSFGPKDVRELRRFCIKPNIITKNMASFCLKKFIDLYNDYNSNIKAIISFSDPTVGDIGTIYKASNWKQMSDSIKSYHYVDPKTNRQIHKKTVWDMAKSNHMKEQDFVNSCGLIKVVELPKNVWLKLF
jgi:hypothetical protein